jgi:hypothetical protein
MRLGKSSSNQSTPKLIVYIGGVRIIRKPPEAIPASIRGHLDNYNTRPLVWAVRRAVSRTWELAKIPQVVI